MFDDTAETRSAHEIADGVRPPVSDLERRDAVGGEQMRRPVHAAAQTARAAASDRPRAIALGEYSVHFVIFWIMLRAPACAWSADMEEFSHLFEGVADPRRSNATLHDLDEMPMIGLLSSLCGGEGCTDMERFGRAREKFLRSFMRLPHDLPGHDAFTNLFNALAPGGLQRAMLRLAEG